MKLKACKGWMAVVLLVFLVNASQSALAATVRGKLIRGKAGVPGVAVSLVNGQNSSTLRVYSDASGMYYIPNVKAGTYTLQVWAVPNKAPLTFPNVQVTEPVKDVNPILLR